MGMPFGYTVLRIGTKALFGINHEIQWQTDREITTQCRVHGDECTLRGLLQSALVSQYSVDDRFSVLAFANLEIGGIFRGLNKIAFRIDMK